MIPLPGDMSTRQSHGDRQQIGGCQRPWEWGVTPSGYGVSFGGDEEVLAEKVPAVVAAHAVNVPNATELYTLKCLPLNGPFTTTKSNPNIHLTPI